MGAAVTWPTAFFATAVLAFVGWILWVAGRYLLIGIGILVAAPFVFIVLCAIVIFIEEILG